MIFGNSIQFYNKIFVPTVKPHLVKNSDFKFLEKKKTKISKVVQSIVKIAKFSHWNKPSDMEGEKKLRTLL